MEEQRERARSSREVTNYMGADATVYDEIDPSVTTEFTGYDHLEDTSKVTVLTTETEIAESLMEGQKGTIFVEKLRSTLPWAVRKATAVSSKEQMVYSK